MTGLVNALCAVLAAVATAADVHAVSLRADADHADDRGANVILKEAARWQALADAIKDAIARFEARP